MSTISTSGISVSQVIRAEHLLRIIGALNGTLNNTIILSGSLSVTGSATFNSGITGSLQGTASFATSASFALTSSITTAITGSTGYIPMFTGSRALKNSNIYQDKDGRVGIGISEPQECASLEISSYGNKAGLILPIVESTGSINSPVRGLIIFDMSVKKVAVYESTTWKYLAFQ
jgi:hypothetical protein